MLDKLVDGLYHEFATLGNQIKSSTKEDFIEYCKGVKTGICSEIIEKYGLDITGNENHEMFVFELEIDDPEDMADYLIGLVWDKYNLEEKYDICSFKMDRLKDNIEERRFFEMFLATFPQKMNRTSLDHIIFPPVEDNDFVAQDELSEREKRIVVSTIQWLGTISGRKFLYNMKYEDVRPYKSENKMIQNENIKLWDQLKKIPNWIKFIFS